MFPISTNADRENVTPQVYVGSHAVFGWAAAAKDNFHFFSLRCSLVTMRAEKHTASSQIYLGSKVVDIICLQILYSNVLQCRGAACQPQATVKGAVGGKGLPLFFSLSVFGHFNTWTLK